MRWCDEKKQRSFFALFHYAAIACQLSAAFVCWLIPRHDIPAIQATPHYAREKGGTNSNSTLPPPLFSWRHHLSSSLSNKSNPLSPSSLFLQLLLIVSVQFEWFFAKKVNLISFLRIFISSLSLSEIRNYFDLYVNWKRFIHLRIEGRSSRFYWPFPLAKSRKQQEKTLLRRSFVFSSQEFIMHKTCFVTYVGLLLWRHGFFPEMTFVLIVTFIVLNMFFQDWTQTGRWRSDHSLIALTRFGLFLSLFCFFLVIYQPHSFVYVC